MDYGTLKERTLELLGRNAVSLAFDMATSQLDDALRIREMEAVATVAASGGEIALPADFIEAQSVENVTGGFLKPVSHERRVELASTGTPTHYTVGNGTLHLNPAPEDGHEVKIIYFAKLAPLVDSGDTNAALGGGAVDAYVYATLAHHARLIRDVAALQFWEPEAAKAVAMANKSDLASRFNGGTLEVNPVGTVV
tara:strand:+ start:916 stop:1503 length:588 start_codon:yes stop_codon:yes gene_type:complete